MLSALAGEDISNVYFCDVSSWFKRGPDWTILEAPAVFSFLQ